MIARRCKSLPGYSVSMLISLLADRTVKLLGQGTFGKVVEAIDTQTNKRVAIKIIRAIPKYRDASKIEVRVLQKLKERDPINQKCAMFNKSHILLLTLRYLANASIYCNGLITAITYA